MNIHHTTLAAAVVGVLAGSAAAQEFVRTAPSFAPNGNSVLPWNTLAVGLWAAPHNGTVTLNAGTYFEPGLISPGKTVRLTATGGLARIGTSVPTRTSLRIASYNTHLFGNPLIPGLPRWNDTERAPHIGRIAINEQADVFLMQEVWDPDLFQIIRNTALSAYPHGFYGGDKEGSSVLDSGLFMMSKYTLSNPQQVFFADENGFLESMASKGYLRSTFVKNGFTVTVYDTHTQSGSTSGDVDTRLKQLTQLAVDVQVWRALHPSEVTVVTGDFNAWDLSPEYVITMNNLFGTNDHMGDGGANMPVYTDPHACTTCYSNDLRRYFNSDDTSNWRIDYILYAGSPDGTVRVLPKNYAVRDYEIPTGYSTLCGDNICTRDLSDHYGIVLDVELQRP